MFVGALQSHETTAVRFVTMIGNHLFNHEISIDTFLMHSKKVSSTLGHGE